VPADLRRENLFSLFHEMFFLTHIYAIWAAKSSI